MGIKAIVESHFGKNAEEAWAYLSRVMQGKEETTQERVMSDGSIVEVRVRPTISERTQVAELAIAYLEGKPHQTATIEHKEVPGELPDDVLKLRVAEILARFAQPALQQAAPKETVPVSVKVTSGSTE